MKLIPEDLTVDIRGGKLYLASDGKVVDVVSGSEMYVCDGDKWEKVDLG